MYLWQQTGAPIVIVDGDTTEIIIKGNVTTGLIISGSPTGLSSTRAYTIRMLFSHSGGYYWGGGISDIH